MAAPAAANYRAEVELKTEPNFGRMIVTFPDLNIMPAYKVESDNGVLVLKFDQPVDLNTDNVPSILHDYVMIARADPEGLGARFALARMVKVNTMEAGPQLFIDFLSPNWSGPPPRLPDEVIAALAKRAEAAAIAAKQAEMMKVEGNRIAHVDVSASRTPTFSRITFKWNVPFEANFHRQDTSVSVVFNRLATADISDIKANLPPFVDDMSTVQTDKGVAFNVAVQPVADVRAFKDENTYVIDVQGPPDPSTMAPIDQALQSAVGIVPETTPGATDHVSAPGQDPTTADSPDATAHGAAAPDAAAHGDATAAHTEAGAHAAPADHAATPAEGAPAPAHENVDANAGHAAPTEAGHAPVTEAGADAPPAQDTHAEATPPAPADHAAAEAPTEAAHPAPDAGAHAPEAPAAVAHAAETLAATNEAPVTAGTTSQTDTTAAPHAAANEPSATAAPQDQAELPDNALTRVLTDGIIRVDAKRVGQATHLVFPYQHPTGSALFTRGNTLWMVFDDPAPIDSASLQDALAGFARSIEPMTIGDAQALRIEMAKSFLATIGPDGNNWVVTIGELVTDPPRPLPISRNVHLDGSKSLDVPFGQVSKIHRFQDPSSGETLFVVTGKGQPRGLIKPQSFAEMDALQSAHGLAFIPKVDDLEVTASGELVSISRPGGMAVSTVAQQKKASLLDLPLSLGSTFNRKNGYVDFHGMAASDPQDFWDKRHKMTLDVAQAREMPERVEKWYKTATFNLANGLGPETIGPLNLIGMLAPEETASDRMAVLRAGGELLTYRPEETLKLLDRPEFSESPDASVWRGMAYADLGKYPEAQKEFVHGDVAIGTFPPLIQRRYMLDDVATAIELKDFTTARDLLAKIDPQTLSKPERAKLDLLSALARDAAGHVSDAIELLSNIVRESNGPTAAEATYRLVQMQRREGLITLDQGIDRLEQLAVAWRGDEIELKTLRLLSQYSVERGNYRRAFEVMRVAEQVNPNAKTTRLISQDMQSAFAQLFLDGKADSMKPIDALALYYDFRELTPNGRRGDAMVRKLADRLVDVDLLPQASQLLDYQVQNRLRGAARAQVAADLAMIYLLDHRPDKALLTLAKTRQAELPVAIERQRRTVEAKAMADSGNPDGALELVRPLDGPEVDRLRADILWSANRYGEAGDQFERLLGGRWNDNLPLSPVEQLEVLKAGIGYTLVNDRLSVDRLRSKYAGKMAETPNGSAFEAVTGPITANGANFDEVVKSVGSADTMSSFLSDYRKRYLDIGVSDKPAVIDGAGGPSADAAAPTDTAPRADAGQAGPSAG